jgi:hypothetical protein
MNHGKCLPGISRWLCTAALGSVVFLGSDRAAEAKGTEPVKLQRLKASKNSFGTPLKTPDDLQHMLLLKRLDVETVLADKSTGWTGRLEDLRLAAKTAKLAEITIQAGEGIPWMAERRGCKPRVVKPSNGMVWAGSEPLKAYTLTFISNDREWTLVAPKANSNFWITSVEVAPNCRPTTCATEGVNCGTIPDGCGRILSCGAPCTVAACFHEDQEIQFAPSGSAYGRDGLIMHDNADFGDTSQREGWYWLGVRLRQQLGQPWVDTPPRQLTFDTVLRKLEPEGNGIFVRAPGKDPFGRPTDGNDKHGTTRDQLVPLIAAMSAWGKHDELQRLWYALPEDIAGKHDFQGHWHNFTNGVDSYTADPCNDIKNRSCAQKVDTRDCSRGGVCGSALCPCEVRRCRSDCVTKNCTRPCIFNICGPEVCVPGIDLDCEGKKVDCERLKAQEDAACRTAELGCTLGKETQNALYAGEAAACAIQRTADLALCMAEKETGALLFTGDPLPPMTYNLFVRAGVVPITLFPVTATAVSPAGLAAGEIWLKGSVDFIRHRAHDDRDYVDQDMNTIAMLLTSRQKLSTPVSEAAIASYRSRAHSYGSYFERYCQVYGPLVLHTSCPPGDLLCCKTKECLNAQLEQRIKEGIASGWPPDGPGFGPYGAVRWYNRWSTKANPRLALLYGPIIENLLK